ncbi:amidohydrolase family protein [Streptosporangium lutulentum]
MPHRPRPRLTIGWTRKAETQTVPNPPAYYLRRLHYDTAVFSGEMLERLIEEVGAERVLLGTDMPFDLADVDAASTVGKLSVAEEARDAILGGNAERLISALAERARPAP